jgi:hypothetical protein
MAVADELNLINWSAAFVPIVRHAKNSRKSTFFMLLFLAIVFTELHNLRKDNKKK